MKNGRPAGAAVRGLLVGLGLLVALGFLVAPGGATPASGDAPASAEAIPARPELLRFPERPFVVPTPDGLRHELSNGIPVYVVEDHALPLVDVTLALPIGDFLDPPGQVGLASLTGALVRRGGTARRSPEAFDEAVDRIAADLDSLTGGTRAGVTLECTSDVLDAALELWAEMVVEPGFDEGRLADAKRNLLAGLPARDDDPLAVLERRWAALLHGGEGWRARRVTAESLAAITREDLIAFHRRWWRPDATVVAVAGDVVAEEVVARLEALLGGWAPAGSHPPPPPVGGTPAPPGLYPVEHPSPQMKVSLGHLGATRRSWDDAEPFALAVLDEVLDGEGMVSRLRSRLRAEAGLVYRASASLGIGLHGPGEVQVFLEVEPGNLAEAVALAVGEMERLRDEPVGEVELRLAKQSLLDAFPAGFDGAETIAGRFAEDELLGRPHGYWASWRGRIAAVTAAEVQDAARRHLRPEELRVVVVGPWARVPEGDRERLRRLAGGPAGATPDDP